MTWDAYHRRRGLLREIFAVADRDRTASLSDLLVTLDPHRVAFEDETAALFEIQMAWFQRLNGHLDRLAVEGTDSPELVAVAAWVATAADLPGARALLDAHRDIPALAKARSNEQALLAASAGVPAHHPDLRGHGERIIDAARTEAAAAPAPVEPMIDGESADQPRGIMARLKSVIAA